MASHWIKKLQCKSTVLHDVIQPPNPNPKPKKPSLPIISCSSNSSVSLQNPEPKKKPKKSPKRPKKPKTLGPPALSELPPGHSSRRVVEIIFTSSWAHTGPFGPFPGRIHFVFRIHNPSRTLARFEDYRAAVRSNGASDVRCAVDGNEMMRFHCSGEFCDEDSGIRTFEGSGGAHESEGNGPGRRAMLVSRVIAGRVRSGSGLEAGGDSVAVGKGEILVFDSRAVLPCFLIIYEI